MKPVLIFLMLVWCGAACNPFGKKPTRTDTTTSGVALIAVDDCLGSAVQECINVFEAAHQAAALLPLYASENEVINMLLSDSVRFAVIARPLTDAEIQTIKSRRPQLQPRISKLATDGIAIIVNRDNPDTLMSIETLQQIMTGKLTSWQALNPRSRLGKIITVFDNLNSSAARLMRDSVCGGEPLWDGLHSIQNNLSAINYVARTPNAMGIVGVGWVSSPNDTSQLSFNERIRVVSVSRTHPAVPATSYKPYPAYLHLRRYPLTRSAYAALTDLRGTLPAGFAHFMLGERGQRIILKAGLVPATPPLRTIQVGQ